ncbi:MAG: hypothetical protein WC735_04720 [Candidatus Paceibacterota bacterium]
MSDAVSNDVSAINPTIWSDMVQQPLYKTLVALKVCNTRLADKLTVGKAIQLPRYGDLSAQTYTPGTDLTATNQEWDFDTINVSTFKHCTFYVNRLRTLGETLLIKFRKLRENLTETIRSETQKWGRSTTIIGISCPLTI